MSKTTRRNTKTNGRGGGHWAHVIGIKRHEPKVACEF